jgi:predicted alpha/beta superfamily hydrolase
MTLCVAALAGCGGGSSPADGQAASIDSRTIASRFTQTNYPVNIYLPPAKAGLRSTLPVIYLLDGESWF